MDNTPQQDPKPDATSDQAASTIKLTEDQEKRLDYFLTAPLRSANRLMEQLYSSDTFYEQTAFAWVREQDAKKLFLYGVCKEVLKMCIGLIGDREALEERLNQESDRISKITIGAITDTQTYRIRKMVELLTLLILFDRNTKSDKEYRIFLSAENLDLALTRQQDFRDLYEKRIISNTQSSIDDFTNRIIRDMDSLGVIEV